MNPKHLNEGKPRGRSIIPGSQVIHIGEPANLRESRRRRPIPGVSLNLRKNFEDALRGGGLSEADAQATARDRHPSGDPTVRLTEAFQQMGLSEEAARSAAEGRNPRETAARLAEAAGPVTKTEATFARTADVIDNARSPRSQLIESLRAMGMTDEEARTAADGR